MEIFGGRTLRPQAISRGLKRQNNCDGYNKRRTSVYLLCKGAFGLRVPMRDGSGTHGAIVWRLRATGGVVDAASAVRRRSRAARSSVYECETDGRALAIPHERPIRCCGGVTRPL